MDTSFSNSVGNHGTPISDKSTDHPQDTLRQVSQGVNDTGASIGSKVNSALGQTTKSVKQGIDAVKNSVQQTRDSVTDSAEALVSYTKDNPVKALLIAAASGALLWSILKAISPSRD